MSQDPKPSKCGLTECQGRPMCERCLSWERPQIDTINVLRAEVKLLRSVLRLAREGYASEAVTGTPVLPSWRDRTMALIDAAMKDPK